MGQNESEKEVQVPPFLEGLIIEGWRRSEMIYEFIKNNPVSPFINWPNRLIMLGFLTFATSMAKTVDMDRTDFMALCAGLFDNIKVTISKKSIPTATTTPDQP